MALLPKSYRNGKRIKVFKYNGVEIFEANYIKEKEALNKKCYHKHKGKENTSGPDGCYSKKTAYGGKCPGHTIVDYYECNWCGHRFYSKPSKCDNPVCGGVTAGYSFTTFSHRDTCKTASECSKWNWDYKWTLDCGYDEDDGI